MAEPDIQLGRPSLVNADNGRRRDASKALPEQEEKRSPLAQDLAFLTPLLTSLISSLAPEHLRRGHDLLRRLAADLAGEQLAQGRPLRYG